MIYAYTSKVYKPLLEKNPRLVSIGREKVEGAFIKRFPHSHNYLEILLIYEGTGIHSIEDETRPISAGTILIHNSHCIHERKNSENIRLYSCFIGNVSLRGLPFNCLVPDGYSPFVQLSEAELSQFISINEEIYQLCCNNEAEMANHLLCYYILKLYALIQKKGIMHSSSSSKSFEEKKNNHVNIGNIRIIGKKELDDNEPEQKPAYYLAKSIMNYLNEHYDNDTLSLQIIAEHHHISLHYLSHIFKNFYGISPMQYVKQRRVGEAQTLLMETDYNITEIALKVGFSSANQFHHVFVRLLGTSPVKYRSLLK